MLIVKKVVELNCKESSLSVGGLENGTNSLCSIWNSLAIRQQIQKVTFLGLSFPVN